jgi:hypothetical protein
MNLKMNIGVNRSTKELIGYSKPQNGRSIVVTAYAVDDLQKKFDKAKEKFLKEENLRKRKPTPHTLPDETLSDLYGGSLSG